MAEFPSRKRFAIHFGALTFSLLSFVFLGGCAVTPKTAAPRFDSFSQVTTDISTQVINAYMLDDAIAKKARIMDFVTTYDPGRSVFLTPPTAVPNNVLHTRQVLILGLTTYAMTLKNIMDDSPINTFSEKAKAAGKELDGIKNNLSPLGISSPTGISAEEVGKAVAEVGAFLINLERRQFLKEKIAKMDPDIKLIVEFLKADLGTCERVKNAGITYYCLGNDKAKLPGVTNGDVTTASGLGADFCTNFVDYQVQHQLRLSTKGTKPARLSGDQFKLAEQQALVGWSAKTACDALQLLNKCLDDYAGAHHVLVTAFDDKNTVLATELNTLTVQIAQVKKWFDSVIAN